MPSPLWTISRKTMSVFDQLARELFVDSMVVRLGRDFPDQRLELGPDRMVREVERGIAEAAKYQIVATGDVGEFLQLWFRAARDPERRWPWFARLFRNKETSARVRIELVEKMLAAGAR